VKPRPDGGSIFWIELPAQLTVAIEEESLAMATLGAGAAQEQRQERQERQPAVTPQCGS
jgi:hypothetical protein